MSWWRFSRHPAEAGPEPMPHTEERPTALPKQVLPSQGWRGAGSTPAKAGGEPIQESERARLEAAFNHDFSDVRIHRDGEAAELSGQAQANAFTAGRHIYFARGAYSNLRLAHELAHVVQQSQPASIQASEDPPLERNAQEAAGAVASGGMANLSPAHAVPMLQRDPLTGSTPLKIMPTYSRGVDSFDIDKAVLSDDQKVTLLDLAKQINSTLVLSPDSFVTIVGFTDYPGGKEHNRKLGQERADAVMAYLAEAGVPAEVMHAMSLGDELPVVPAKGYEAKNRRVEIDVTARSFFKPPILTPPTKWTTPTPPPAFKPPDLNYHPPIHMPTPEEEVEENIRRNEENWKRAQEILEREKARPGTSISDAFGRAGRELARKLGLPKSLQDRAESLAKDLPAMGAKAVFDQITADKELSGQEKNAVHAVIDALSQTKMK